MTSQYLTVSGLRYGSRIPTRLEGTTRIRLSSQAPCNNLYKIDCDEIIDSINSLSQAMLSDMANPTNNYNDISYCFNDLVKVYNQIINTPEIRELCTTSIDNNQAIYPADISNLCYGKVPQLEKGQKFWADNY